jgi:hypothetical protein
MFQMILTNTFLQKNENKFFIYLMNNEDFTYRNRIKYGYSKYSEDYETLINRLHDNDTHHTEYCEYMKIYEFEKTNKYSDSKCPKEPDKLFSSVVKEDCIKGLEKYMEVELPHMNDFKQHLSKSDCLNARHSHEFMNNSPESINEFDLIMKDEFPKLGLKFIKEFSEEEINHINQSSRDRITEKDKESESFINLLKEQNKPVLHLEHNFPTRLYQEEIIKYLKDVLINESRSYLELATGGGKTYIIYRVLEHFMPDTIIMFSPRKKINQQNSSNNYQFILKNKYNIYNCSVNNNFEYFKNKCKKENKKMIIVACPQSSNEKVYNIINNYNLENIFIWFDEAHHTIEKWNNNLDKLNNKYIKFFLENDEKIKNRIFTSASPDKKYIKQISQIFGTLYSPIKVNELIKQKWLCPINCKIFEYDITNMNILNWVLKGFIDNNKSHGFSFHSRDNNAFNLFYEHYQLYLNNKTKIKPYLLIHDSGLNDSNKKKLKDIKLKYDFRNVKNFENKVLIEENPQNMAYVVKQYDMGYDFQGLDYIVITDAKVSFKDIIQCIGRGTRPDKKGPNGTNLDKELLLMLPTYVKQEDVNEYKNIIEVLRYLILDLEMDIEEILIKKIDSTEAKETPGMDYIGTKENTSKLLDLLYSNNVLNRVNTKTLNKFCLKYGIKTEQDYYRFKELNPSLNLKSNLYKYPGFYWKNVVDPNNQLYYSSKQECIKAKEKIISEAESLEDEKYEELMIDIDDDGWIELNKHDSKIPPYRDLDKFYPQL